MTRSFVVLLAAASPVWAAETPNLSDYIPPEKATPAVVRPAKPGQAGLAGYLGVAATAKAGKLVVAEIAPDSPAEKAGLKKGDAITKLDDQSVSRVDQFRDLILSRSPGDAVTVYAERGGQPVIVTATLKAVSRPMRLNAERVYLGAQVSDAKSGEEGTPVERVQAESPAAQAGIKVGDILLKVEGTIMRRAGQLVDALAERKAGDELTLTVRRDKKESDIKVKLAAERRGGSGGPAFGGRGRVNAGPAPSTPWAKPTFRLAVVGIEFEDIKHNAKITSKDWEQALFSKGVFNKKNVTGQDVFGSLNDFFHEQSYGAFKIVGKVFDWVAVTKKRGEYSQGSGVSNRGALPGDAIEKLLAREGKEALKEFDGVLIIYAGAAVPTNPGGVFYPHAGTLFQQGSRTPYVVCYEGGEKMATPRAFAREFAYLLGVPDLAARTENVGSVGAGPWCLLAGPLADHPQSLCCWAKEKLGWIQPAVIDPTVKQKIVLAPIGTGKTQCVKVLARPDGSEYFLLENRCKKNCDSKLPGEGLLIWRVLNDRPVLEASHGIEGSAGSRVLHELAPFPSEANTAFTPLTTPSSRSARGGGLPVHITNIRRLPDGRITFHVGYEYR